MKRTVVLRLFFLLSLGAAAAVCGAVAYSVTTKLEEEIAINTYESVAASALEEAQAITKRKQHGADVLSTVVGFAFPEATMWPFVGLRGYPTIAKKVAKLSSTRGHGFMVIVRPDQVSEFETHAAQLYKDLDYPETAGWSEFGFGINGKDKSSPYSDKRFHDTSGNTTYGSKNSILVPFLQHSNTFSNPSLLLMNLHQQEFRGVVMDSMIECAEKADPSSSSEPPVCAVVTGFTEIFVLPGPSAVLYQPVFPAGDPTAIVGFIGTSVHWQEVLTNVVPDYVDGLDCVISSGTKSYTYVIHKGEPRLVGEGDLHDPAFTDYGHSIVLNDIETNASVSVSYTLTVYPTTLMFDEFKNGLPLYVSLGFVAVILLCTAIFFLYDYFMKHESHQRKKLMELRRRFVRFVSHEIRTPLNVTCMGLELLRAELSSEIDHCDKVFMARQAVDGNSGSGDVKPPDGSSDDDPRTEKGTDYLLDLTGDILENTQNAVSVLNELLNFDKIESGTFKLEVGSVDIWSLVKKTVSEFSIQAQNRKILLDVVTQPDDENEIEGGPGRLRVMGDDIRLAQVIRNLVSNALKFSPEGKGKVTVSTKYIPDGLPDGKKSGAAEPASSGARAGSVRISVKDNGVGLTKEQLGLLFHEGVQFDANRLQNGGGTGLGLCITKEIVEHHGGTIKARSEGRGSGTTFVVEIPLYESDFTTQSSATETTTSLVSTSNVDRHHILVVDDVISNTKMLVRLLERAGHTCAVASNGQEAIEAFVASKASAGDDEDGHEPLFDTVLIDNQMPVVSGPDATRQLREMGYNSFIIGVTGNVLAEDVAHFKASGADYVLPKPVSLAAIQTCWATDEHPLRVRPDVDANNFRCSLGL